MGIAAIVLTYNEEKRIGNVLDNLKQFDDIIVYDKSSTDRTREIAREKGAKVLELPYYNDSPPPEVMVAVKKAAYEMQDNEWILGLTSSDIIHYGLYNEMMKMIESSPDNIKIIEVPLYRYSMGIVGKKTYFGEVQYKNLLHKRETMADEYGIIHEGPSFKGDSKRLIIDDKRIAIYHLTHATLATVMERHWRYAVQYVEDSCLKRNKSRNDIMKYAVKQIIKLTLSFFTKRTFSLGWTGMAQCLMLVMYNVMIFLNAFYSAEREKEIQDKYDEIIKMCRGDKA